MQHRPITFTTADHGEELARADLYGLLARLWLAAPDAELLRQFSVAATQAPEQGGLLEAPWQALVHALRSSPREEITAEFDALFLGVGKPEVFAYGSFYLSGFLNEKPLAALREDLALLGLARDAHALETEDHISYGFEVMRYLIAGDDLGVCHLEQQRRFFRAHLQPWVERFCEAVQAHPRALVYAALAAFTREFMGVETQAFDMVDT